MPVKYQRRKRYAKKRPRKASATKKIVRKEVIRELKVTHPIQFYDIPMNNTVTTTTTVLNLLDPILQNGGFLDSMPYTNQIRNMLVGTGLAKNTEFRKVLISGVHFRFRFVASQASALLNVDLFNCVRHTFIYSDSDYRTAISQYLNSCDGMVDVRDVDRKYFDKTVILSQQAFQSNGYSSPQQKFFQKFVKVNRTLKCFSDSTGTNWNTTKGDMLWEAVSDSSVPPSPSVIGIIRVYFRYMD